MSFSNGYWLTKATGEEEVSFSARKCGQINREKGKCFSLQITVDTGGEVIHR